MYANLTVNIDGTDHAAWMVIIAHGQTRLYLDDPDDESGQAVPAGELSAAAGAQIVRITASF